MCYKCYTSETLQIHFLGVRKMTKKEQLASEIRDIECEINLAQDHIDDLERTLEDLRSDFNSIPSSNDVNGLKKSIDRIKEFSFSESRNLHPHQAFERAIDLVVRCLDDVF